MATTYQIDGYTYDVDDILEKFRYALDNDLPDAQYLDEFETIHSDARFSNLVALAKWATKLQKAILDMEAGK